MGGRTTALGTLPTTSLPTTNSRRSLSISRKSPYLLDPTRRFSQILNSAASHYHLTVLLDGKLFLAPIPEDVKVGKTSPPTSPTPRRLTLPRASLMLAPVPVGVQQLALSSLFFFFIDSLKLTLVFDRYLGHVTVPRRALSVSQGPTLTKTCQ